MLDPLDAGSTVWLDVLDVQRVGLEAWLIARRRRESLRHMCLVCYAP